MATAEQYANWIVKNQDKKGTPEFETVAKAYRAAKTQAPAQEAALPEKSMGAMDYAKEYAKETFLAPLEVPLTATSGLLGQVIGGGAGLGTAALRGMGLSQGDPEETVRYWQKKLAYQPTTRVAKGVTGAMAYPGEKLGELGGWMGGKTTEAFRQLGASPETSAAAGTFVNTGLQAIPLALGTGKTAGAPKKYTKIEQQVAKEAQQVVGKSKDKIIKAMEQYETRITKPTTEQAIAQYRRRLYEAGTPEVFGDVLAGLKQELMKEPVIGDVAKTTLEKQRYARENIVKEIEKTEADLAQAYETRAAETRPGYEAVRQNVIDPRSNQQKIADMLYRAQQRGQTAESSKQAALQDWGRFKTLEANQQARAIRQPSQIGPIAQQLNQQKIANLQSQLTNANPQQARMIYQEMARLKAQQTPTSIQMGDIGGFPRVPARYTPQRAVANEANLAAQEAKNIAAQRLAQETAAKDVQQTALINMVGESNTALSDFLSRPVVKEGIRRARKGAQNAGQYFPETNADNFTVGNLQRIKRAVAAKVREQAKEGKLEATEQAEITGMLDQFNQWIKDRSKGFAETEQKYAELSKPINQMKMGKVLREALVSVRETANPTAFLNALRDVPKTLKRATGWSRYEKLDQVLPKQTVKQLNNVAEELLDLQKSNEMASATRGMLQEMMKSEVAKFPNWLRRDIAITNAILKKVAKGKSPAYKEKWAEILDNPDLMAEYLKMDTRSINYKAATDIAKQLAAISVIQHTGTAGQGE